MENGSIDCQDNSLGADTKVIKSHITEIYNRYMEVEAEIAEEIARLANGDPVEELRIKRIARRQNASDRFAEGFPADDDALWEHYGFGDPEPTFTERQISHAFIQINFCLAGIMGDRPDVALQGLTNAGMYFGAAVGADVQSKQLKRDIQRAAANKLHSENKVSKQFVIEYYRQNHKKFANKDEAAYEIAQKIVPYKFATVRDWLKGVDPEIPF